MTHPSLSSRIDGVFFGKISNRWAGRDPSAIGKTPVSGPQDINEFGFVVDEQADRENHGGVDKAIHHYAADHYRDWITEGEIPAGTTPAAFGENIATTDCGNLHWVAPPYGHLQHGALRRRLEQEPSTPSAFRNFS